MYYRLIADGGALLDEGGGTAEMAGGALVVTPEHGTLLRVAPGDIVELQEPQPYVVMLTLADGARLELSRLGVMRTQLLAELSEARVADTERVLLLDGVGTPEAFNAVVDGVEAELRLYDDALVSVPGAGLADKYPYPFIKGVTTDASGYTISLDVPGRPPVTIGRLARRTTEFLDLLRARTAAASGRTAHFLAALLPGLGPVALRSVAGLLRDGLAAPRAGLEAVEPTVFPALLEAACLPDRAAGAQHLLGLGQTWLGFKQTVSVQRAGSGAGPWRDSAKPIVLDHDAHAGSFASGAAGMFAAGMMSGFDGPFDSFGPALAYGMLGGFQSSYAGGPHLPRDVFQHQPVTPAHTDYAALDTAAVLAFLLVLTPSGHLVYEVLNEADHATYVFSCRDADQLAQLNRALDLVGFRVEGIYADATSAGSQYRKAAERLPALRVLRERFQSRVVHTEGWRTRLPR
ncbi:hypothetical protein Dvina_35340 [Dactylosporangium vinaceum]|uniref:Uncharacterized protein n=1 Tax=Dactylosporangium vinaceum TaxID=53362 RepID=A0ABV5M402_9ACTN|nr:hypothetical protein [Dactylosporangium vinaceum]UAB93499.1 hypothetical protein Dvina_35340 [Dactylosporangium vinaceum]